MDERRDKNRIRYADAERASREAPGAPAPAREKGSFGAWLRAQREARSVSIDAIAEGSKISRRYLEALETDRFDALPAPVFVRGFLREYARIVGLDPDEVVNFYLLARPSTGRDRAGGPAVPSPRERTAAPRSTRLLGWGLLLAAILIAVAVAAAAISWWAGRRTVEREAPVRPVRAAAADEPARPGGVPAGERAAAAAPQAESGKAEMEPPTAAESPSPAAEGARPPALLVADAMLGAPSSAERDELLRVVLEFRQDCWVDVVVDGRRRESELKAGGETLALEAEDHVLLTLGNGPAVRVEVNGVPFALPEQGTRVVRDLRIDRQTVAAVRPLRGEPVRR